VSTYEGMMHMAKAVSSRPCWEAAFTRSRIGRRWGFLPSQLGHRAYPSLQRERALRQTRVYTELPAPPNATDERLRRIVGRDATAVEAELLRDFIWENGRGKVLKRDVWKPTPGYIRRTYQYRKFPYWSRLSKSALLGRGHASPVKKPEYYLPADAYTEEEESGLMMLELWRKAFASETMRE